MIKQKSPLDSSKPHFKNLHSDVKLYIRNLEKENSKLQSEIAKLEVANISITNKAIAYKKEIATLTKNQVKIITKGLKKV